MTINRETIRQHIAGGLSKAKIQSIRQNDADAALFLDILDACLKKTKPKLKSAKNSAALNQDDIELLLMRLLTFRIKKRDASTFLHQLYHNDKFFDHLQPAFSVATTPYPEAAENLKGITLQSDQQIFDYIVKNTTVKKKHQAFRLNKLWDRLLENLKSQSGGFRLPAIAVAAVLIFLLIGHSLRQDPARTDIYKTYFGAETAYASMQLSIHSSANWTSTLRGGGAAIPEGADSIRQPNKASEELANIARDIDIAKDYYLEKNFSEALNLLNGVEPHIVALKPSPAADTLTAQLHFYYGMSHLGLAHKMLSYKAHARKAVDHLKIADNILAVQNGGKHQEDIAFFLGYAYSLLNDKQNAVSVLSGISVESPFYQQSQMLISYF